MSARWLGRFRELTHQPEDPSITSLRGMASTSEAEALARYLRSGHIMIDVTETSRDVIDGSKIRESASILGDGQWIWREDLPHYVAKYRLGLGREFLSSVIGEVAALDESALLAAILEATDVWQRG